MTGLRIGSLFSGYGGLDLAVRSVLGGTVAWHCDNDRAASRLAHHWPDVPNLGDITAVDWARVERVHVLTGGFPCQDLSVAGSQAGLRPGTRSGLWSHFAYAIDQLRPGLVVIENVRGILSAAAHSDVEPCPWCVGGPESAEPPLRALGAVLGDLADIGFDAEWVGLPASAVGANHGRFREFLLAWPVAADTGCDAWAGVDADGPAAGRGRRPVPDTGSERHGCGEDGQGVGRVDVPDAGQARQRQRPREQSGDRSVTDAADTEGYGWDEGRPEPAGVVGGPDVAECGATDWGIYEPAIRRERYNIGTAILGRYERLPDRDVSRPCACKGTVQEALHAPARDGGPHADQEERPQPNAGGPAILGEGQEDRYLLALDWSQGEQVWPREVRGVESASLGLREPDRSNPARADAGSPVPRPCMCEPSAPGASDVAGECPSTMGSESAMPVRPPAVRGKSLSDPIGPPTLQNMSQATRSEIQGATEEIWGVYAPAIARWEAILGRPAPAPTEPAPRGGRRLAAPFVEHMMGLPEGHVTGVPGISRNDMLRLLGNGVVPQQAERAIRALLAVRGEVAA